LKEIDLSLSVKPDDYFLINDIFFLLDTDDLGDKQFGEAALFFYWLKSLGIRVSLSIRGI
jgi:hypothetical protein